MRFWLVIALLLNLKLGLIGCGQEHDYSSQINTLGIETDRIGDVVNWKIPLAQLVESDKKALFSLMKNKFKSGMLDINRSLTEEGINLEIARGEDLEQYNQQTEELIKSITKATTVADVQDAIEYHDVRQMSHWKSYVIPQAYFVYVGGSFDVGMGFGAQMAARVYHVVQPWLKVGIHRITGKQIYRIFELDSTIVGAPLVDLGDRRAHV